MNKRIILSSSLLGGYFLYNYFNYFTDKSYTYNEISKHNNKEKGIWVTNNKNVYDITKFVDSHPGGIDKIMLSAGKGLEPYWKTYPQHNNKFVKEILDKYKIGIIKNYDPTKYDNYIDPYINEPIRSSELIYHTKYPCNAETPLNLLINDKMITPNDLFFIRNHNPIPKINIINYKLNIINEKINNKYSLDELKKYKKKTIYSVIVCAGNRRNEYNKYKETMGIPWKAGAIGNAKWEGILLYDIIKPYLNKDIKYIHFEGYDGVKISIEADKVINDDVILAYKMNDEILPEDHGYPLRVIVPGYIGINNIKWLKNIVLSDKEIESQWEKGINYKIIKNYDKNMNLSKYPTIKNINIQTCITNVNKLNNNIEGYATSSSSKIKNVEVSVDYGITWMETNIISPKEWLFILWEINYDIKNIKEIWCRAESYDGIINTESLENEWNIRGICNDSIYKKYM